MRPLLNLVEAVLFDLDGTLVETNIDFSRMKRTVIALAAEHGVETDGLDGLDILAAVDIASQRLKLRGARVESRDYRVRAMAALKDIELHHARHTREVEHARSLVECLQGRGVKVGIVTRNCRQASEISLQIAQISPDTLVCREDARRQKPDPEQLHTALRTLGVSAEQSIMVGDHLMDVQSGRAACMKTIGIHHDSRPPNFFDAVRPDYVARTLLEVRDAIIGRDC